MNAGLQFVDWVIIAAYALSTIGLGIYFARKQNSTDEYFTGGGKMGSFFIGVSLFATLLSTISYLSMPGEGAGKGPVAMIGMLCYPVIFFVVGYWIIPVYMKQRVTSAYELLEQRLGLSISILGATMFLALRLVWMTLLVYVAANAMAVMMGMDYWVVHQDPWSIDSIQFSSEADENNFRGFTRWQDGNLQIATRPIVVLVAGAVALIYTSLGGLRAVVITDFMQTVLLFGGAVLVLITVTYHFGGFGWFPTRWQDNWDPQPFLPSSINTRVSVVGSFLTILTWYIATLAGDQTSVQRFMATEDAATARRAVGVQLCVGLVVQLTLFAVGFALLAYFLQQREQFPDEFNISENADDLFPHFISYQLPVGVSGLVAAAMFAAAMSSIDSGVNSITAVVTTNYVDRMGWKPKTQKGHLRLAQFIALAVGVIVVMCSSLVKYIDGNITAVTSKTVNLLTTPIFGLFFFALFIKSSRTLGVWIGAICGTATAVVIAFAGPIVVYLVIHHDVAPENFGVITATREMDPETKKENLVPIDPAGATPQQSITTAVYEVDRKTGERKLIFRDPVSFQWIGPFALLVNILTGLAACWVVNLVSPRSDE